MSQPLTRRPIPAAAVDEFISATAGPGAQFRCYPIEKVAVLAGLDVGLLPAACDALIVEHLDFHGQRSMTIAQIHQLVQRLATGDLAGNALAVACRRHLSVVTP